MQVLKDYLSKANAHVQHIGRSGAGHRSEERTGDNMTPDVITDFVLQLQIKGSNKDQINTH